MTGRNPAEALTAVSVPMFQDQLGRHVATGLLCTTRVGEGGGIYSKMQPSPMRKVRVRSDGPLSTAVWAPAAHTPSQSPTVETSRVLPVPPVSGDTHRFGRFSQSRSHLSTVVYWCRLGKERVLMGSHGVERSPIKANYTRYDPKYTDASPKVLPGCTAAC